MPYCRRCGTEYVEGTTQCEDCRVTLLPGSPPESPPGVHEFDEPVDVKLVAIRTFSGAMAPLAPLAKSLLETQGIPCIIPGETSAGLLPVLGVPLLVREGDAERADEVLRGYFDSPGPIPVP